MSDVRSRFPVYAALLRLYPTVYRERYGEEILQTTADMLDEASGRLSRLGIWLHIAADLPINISRQQLYYLGGTMFAETPRYLRRNSVMAGLLLLPFFLALAANGLSKLLSGHDLYHSWLWGTPILGIWIIYLPEAALLLTLATYIAYAVKSADTVSGPVKRAVTIRRIWPLLLPALVAFGILFLVAFHDSLQCWTHNPVHIATHLRQTWQCTAGNQSLRGFTHL